jgi:S-adenosyl-L-methionine hydrolase (adenosine-forming)
VKSGEENGLSNPIITLTTDYGSGDHLAGVLKGVILKIVPNATVVDISHQVVSMDVLDGALMIGNAYKYFPPRTVHLVVVDPGVGTQRRPILVSGDQHFFVAPDNGVLSLVYDREESVTVRHITAEHYFLTPVSNTFHGRDIFAPVAAWLAKTYQSEVFGEEITDFVRFAFPRAKQNGAGLKGVVLRIDNFGNLLTNLTTEDLPTAMAAAGKIKLRIGNTQIEKLAQTFAQGAAGEPIAIVGSSGFIEVAIHKGHAARTLGAQRGSEVTLELA